MFESAQPQSPEATALLRVIQTLLNPQGIDDPATRRGFVLCVLPYADKFEREELPEELPGMFTPQRGVVMVSDSIAPLKDLAIVRIRPAEERAAMRKAPGLIIADGQLARNLKL